MEILQKRIREEGKVLEPDILKVDSFLNHQIDVALFNEIGKAFKERFKDKKINKILTIEASGIALAVIASQYFDNAPVVFVKKSGSKLTNDSFYKTHIHSFTKNVDYKAIVSKDYLGKDDHVLIIDDFLANGEAVLGMYDLCRQALSTVEGIGIVIEKGFQNGRNRIKEATGLDVESLAIVDGFENGKVILR